MLVRTTETPLTILPPTCGISSEVLQGIIIIRGKEQKKLTDTINMLFV
jgi:hypothetical protein